MTKYFSSKIINNLIISIVPLVEKVVVEILIRSIRKEMKAYKLEINNILIGRQNEYLKNPKKSTEESYEKL